MLLREGALIITGTCAYPLRCANVAAAEVGQRVTLVWPHSTPLSIHKRMLNTRVMVDE
jgi:hypothetical protein